MPIKKKINKRPVVKVNWIGMSLVIAVFLLNFLIVAEVNLEIVSAVSGIGSTSGVSGISSSSSVSWRYIPPDAQYTRPGTYQSFSQKNAAIYWPALSNRDTCEASTDFLIFIRPGGCTPQVVRSDLLEEQNVPIFCKVDLVKLNPLIDITQLKSVKFKGDYGKYVAGVSFHPNQEAVYSHRVYLDNPLINDAGYVVVLLKRIEKEADMPDSVQINLTGVLRYDSEGFLGSGQNNYYLEVMDDEKWEIGDEYKENSFFKGEGYLRAEWIEGDSARILVYRDQDTLMSSFTLKKGETSAKHYLPGFYCKAGYKVRLDNIVAGVEKVNLDVNGESIWLVEGEKFLDNQCRVVSINVDDKNKKSAKISCLGGKSKTFYYTEGYGITSSTEELTGITKEPEEIGTVIKDKNEVYYKKNAAGTGEQDWYKIESAGDKILTWKTAYKFEDILKTGQVSKVEIVSKETTVENKPVENEDLSRLINDVFGKATKYAEDIEGYYGAGVEGDNAWAANALYLLGDLARQLKKKKDALDIFSRVIRDYPDTSYARQASSGIGRVGAESVNYRGYEINLIKIETPGKADASASFVISKIGEKTQTPETGIQKGDYFYDKRFKMLELYPDKVDLYYYGSGEKNDENDKEYIGKFTLNYGEEEQKGNYLIRLDEINYTQVAKVSVISEISNEYSEANFTFEVGIEKRAIELSPEKIKEKIENLNQSIKDLENIVEKLGNVVKGMKAACFATSAILIVKNFFANLEGGATARQAVMPAWYIECDKIAGEDKTEFNKCLKDKNNEIEQDVSNYQKNIEALNKEIIELQKVNKYPGTNSVNRDVVTEKFRSLYFPGEEYEQASLTDMRDLKLNQLIEQSGSEVAKKTASAKIASIEARLDKKQGGEGLYTGDGYSWVNKVKTSYYMTGDSKGLAYYVPIPKSYTLEKSGKTCGQLGGVWYNGDLEGAEDLTLNVISSYERKEYVEQKKYKCYKLTAEQETKVKDSTIKVIDVIPISGDTVTGFYAVVDEDALGRTGYTKAGDITEFWIQNIGSDGEIDVKDESNKILINMVTYSKGQSQFGLSPQEFNRLVQDAIQALKTASRNYGQSRFNLFGIDVLVDKAGKTNEARCQDFMSPKDCLILFNVCDPVICPSSRCDLGGDYRVDDVIQSGIIGSIVLCLPNAGEGIIVPVCLSGVHAGLDSFLSILKSHRDCLQEQLDTGKTVGICDEIYSIYLCEFFWRQVGPFLNILLMKMIESSYGQGMKGGGEYLTVNDAWQKASQSIAFLKNDYAANSYKAFQLRSTGEIGTEFCKAFTSIKYPNKGIFDSLIEPDSPVQFHAWFDEIPYTEATVPATSQYKVFYHIYAGKDIGASYQIYLKDPSESAYVNVQDTILVDTGYVPKGGYASQTRDFTAPAGYKQLCVRINGQDECDFKKVSTSYAINYISDMYYQEQLQAQIRTKEECVSGTPSALALAQPNIQEGVQNVITPNLDKKGVVRICATDNPGGSKDSGRWLNVGFCDDESVRCWLDKNTVEDVIKNKNISASVIQEAKEFSGIIEEMDIMDKETVNFFLGKAKKMRDSIEKASPNDINTINSILNTENTGKTDAYGINLKEMILELEAVEDRAAFNEDKAEAAYYKFILYHAIGEKLAKINTPPMETGPAETPTPSVTEEPETEETKTEEREKWTFDSALSKTDELIKKYGGDATYSSYPEITTFIDELSQDDKLYKNEYENINGMDIFGWTRIGEENLEFLRGILREKKAEEDRKAREQESGEKTTLSEPVLA